MLCCVRLSRPRSGFEHCVGAARQLQIAIILTTGRMVPLSLTCFRGRAGSSSSRMEIEMSLVVAYSLRVGFGDRLSTAVILDSETSYPRPL